MPAIITSSKSSYRMLLPWQTEWSASLSQRGGVSGFDRSRDLRQKAGRIARGERPPKAACGPFYPYRSPWVGNRNGNKMPWLTIHATPRQPSGFDNPPNQVRWYRSFLVVPYRQYRSHSLKDFHLFYSFLVSHLHLNHRLQVGLSIVQTGIAVSGDHSCLGPPPPKSWASRCLISSRVGSSICVAIAQLNPNGSLTRP